MANNTLSAKGSLAKGLSDIIGEIRTANKDRHKLVRLVLKDRKNGSKPRSLFSLQYHKQRA